MKVVALISGGKDSCHSMYLCQQHGHKVVALANLLPEATAPDELDSYMYQTVGHQLVQEYATCMGLPLFRKHITGRCASTGLSYSKTEGDEVEDLFQLLSYVLDAVPGIGAVSSGAIASDYQRLRVEHVCSRLGLVSLAYMWHVPQRQLLRNMIECNLHAVLVKVAALGLSPNKHLGRSLAQLEPYLIKLSDQFGANVCGEGGEYESLVLDCSLFTRGSIHLDAYQVVLDGSSGGDAAVGYLHPELFHVEAKPGWESLAANDAHPPDVQLVPQAYVSQRERLAAHKGSIAALTTTEAAGTTVSISIRVGKDFVQVTANVVPHSAAGEAQLCLNEFDTKQALLAMLEGVEQELKQHGLSLQHSIFVHMFLSNMDHFAAANAAYSAHFSAVDPPSRACVQVPLPSGCPAMLDICLAAQSIRSSSQACPQSHRKVLHVQSISSWAPSCIGPYSQANTYKNVIHLAGMLPLDPGSMTIVSGGVEAQIRQAFSSCEAVSICLCSSILLAAVGITVFYVVSLSEADVRLMKATVAEVLQGKAAGTGKADLDEQPGVDFDSVGFETGLQTSTFSNTWRNTEETHCSSTSSIKLDPYLVTPVVAHPTLPEVLFVCVPALPRGALVEVAAHLLDLAGLETSRTGQREGPADDLDVEAQSTPASAPGSSGSQGSLECSLKAMTNELSCGNEPLVICTTTDQTNKVLRSLIHLPQSFFTCAETVGARILAEVTKVLDCHGMDMHRNLMTGRCWFVSTQVPATIIEAAKDKRTSFHIAWVPVSDVSTAAGHGCVAVLELVASQLS